MAPRTAGDYAVDPYHAADYFDYADTYFHHYFNMRAASTLSKNLRPERTLDIGAGRGGLVRDFGLLGHDAWGVDVSSAVQGRLLAPGRVLQADILTQPLPFPADHFDLVTCIEVVEHLPRHDAYVREAVRVLKPGGALFLQTPLPGTGAALGDPTHISVQSRKEWVRLHEEAGLRRVDGELRRWEHELPMTSRGERLGWLRYTPPVKLWVVKRGTRSLYRKRAAA